MWSTLHSHHAKKGGLDRSNPSRLLIFGPNKTGKTSIAFRMAYESASTGSTALFVCLLSTISNTFPPLVTVASTSEQFSEPVRESLTSSWSPEILSRIMIKYVSNSADLKKLFASIHMFHPRPGCIIVDDFTLIIDPMSTVSRQDNMFLEISQVLGSFIVDAIDYLDKVASAASVSSPHGNRLCTKLVLTSNCLDSSFENIMLRYASCALIFRTKIERTGSMSASYNSSDSNRLSDTDKGIRLTMRRPVSPSESEEVTIFSKIKFTDGRLVCHP